MPVVKRLLKHWWDTDRDNFNTLASFFEEYRQIVRRDTIAEVQQVMNDNPIMSWGDEIINMLKESNNDVFS